MQQQKATILMLLSLAQAASAQQPKTFPLLGNIQKQQVSIGMQNDQNPVVTLVDPGRKTGPNDSDNFTAGLRVGWKLFGDQGSLEIDGYTELYSRPVGTFVNNTWNREALVRQQLDVLYRKIMKDNTWQVYGLRYHHTDFGGTPFGADRIQEGFHKLMGNSTYQYNTIVRPGVSNSVGGVIGRGRQIVGASRNLVVSTTAEILGILATQHRSGVELRLASEGELKQDARWGLYGAVRVSQFTDGFFERNIELGLRRDVGVLGSRVRVKLGAGSHDSSLRDKFPDKTRLIYGLTVSKDF